MNEPGTGNPTVQESCGAQAGVEEEGLTHSAGGTRGPSRQEAWRRGAGKATEKKVKTELEDHSPTLRGTLPTPTDLPGAHLSGSVIRPLPVLSHSPPQVGLMSPFHR